jgi:tape measure domain-containing protein
MATNNKDIRLGIGVEVNNAEAVAKLGKELRELGETTKTTREAESAASAEQRDAADALNQKRIALERLKAESTAASRATAEYVAAEKALKLEVIAAREALNQKRTATQAAAAESRAAAAAEQAVATQLQRTQAAYRETAAAAASSAAQQSAALREVSGPLETLQGQFAAVRNVAALALSGSLVGTLAKDLSETADAAANLRARISLITGEGPALQATYQEVFAIAKRTGTELDAVGALYTKLASAGKELGTTNAQALQLTETVTQALQLSGATVQETQAAALQLGQALASGRLQGDELRSILESGPRLARALAEGLGVSVGALKDLGSTGALTAQQVTAALLGQSQTLQAEFEKLPPTVGRAIANLGTAWTEYIGKADAASGASKTAAGAINALANNLDTLGAVLFSAGKAAAAYAAIGLAQSFLATRAAVVATTVAVTANTVATTANTAAQVANAAAGAATINTAGRLGATVRAIGTALGGLKLAILVAVATNIREIGTFLGETAAKLAGYKIATDDADAAQRAAAESARENATALAAQAQATQLATDKALGLGKEARAVVAEFDGLILKGESTADALSKVGKSLDLSDVRGITIAGAALDALAVKGKITADQLRETLGAALKGEDLGKFEVQARAAFDGSAQGVRRLATALDALRDEALKRAGTSVRELATGFNDLSVSALNDVDALSAALVAIKAPADAAGRALSASLDKALTAATTERAVQAVIQRMEDLGKSGQLAGDRLTEGLEKARKKLDELRPGINSLDEALQTLGLKTRAELAQTADKLGQAYARIASDGTVSLAQQVEAYGKWRTAALAASGGVETGQLQLQRIILENRGAVLNLGDGFTKGMGAASKATRTTIGDLEQLIQTARTAAGALVSGSSGLGTLGNGSDTAARNATVPSGRTPSTTRTAEAGQAVNKPGEGWFYSVDPYVWTVKGLDSRGNPLPGGWAQSRNSTSGIGGGNPGFGNLGPGTGLVLAPAPAPAPAAAPAPALQPIVVNIGGITRTINVGNKTDADNLLALLEQAARANVGP